ncbi:MAG: hypothetical protein WA948_04955 [Pontixanthobacter sp.]
MIVQLAMSLVAILAIGWLAARLKLGGDRRIANEDEARVLAEEAVSGFDPVDIAIDRGGHGALLRDKSGRILMLRQHGSHFAGRLFDRQPDARLDRDLLIIEGGDRPFGAVTLDLGPQAQTWAATLRSMTPGAVN